MSTCKNCGSDIAENYCPNCGEKRDSRIRFRDVMSDFSSNLITFEGPILRTAKDLTIRPGKMCREYLDGRRKVYAKPFQYYLLALTIYYVFYYIWGSEIYDYMSGMSGEVNTTATDTELQDFQLKMKQIQQESMRVLLFLQVPLYAMCVWLFFKRSGRSFIEALVVMLYLMGHNFYLGIITLSLVWVHPVIAIMAGAAVTFAYLAWTFYQLFDDRLLVSMLKSLVIFIITFIMFGLLIGVISIAQYVIMR